MPGPLAPLGDLVTNLRWSWHPATRDLFASVDPELWESVEHDPVKLLGEVSVERLDELAGDTDFLARLTAAHTDLQEYLNEPRWYQTLDEGAPRLIAYFSPEFGVTEVLPQYSGGLGILAGDHLKTASDLGVPILGVGLLYRSGYFSQSLTPDGWQSEHYPALDPHGLPLRLLLDADGNPVQVAVGLPEGRTLRAQIWQAYVGRVTLLLLDSDIESNAPTERVVTDRLYGGGIEHRLYQEVLLGIGGIRAVRAWCAIQGRDAPEVYHTNEGHAGFLGVERIRELVEGGGLEFDAAQEVVRAGTVFTTHTPVPAGIDRFPRDLIEHFFGGANAVPGVPVERVLELGSEPDPSVFNMAHMGLRLAQRCNGVSVLHGQVSREMFASLWPGFEVDEVPIGSVTNGVHAQSWLSRDALELAERSGVDPLTSRDDQAFSVVDKLDDNDLWELRRRMRVRLIGEARRRLRASYLNRGTTEAELTWLDDALDPDVLTIGFARRVPSYKRLTLMLRDRDRLKRLLLDPNRPVQILLAGKAHPADDAGKKLIQEMVWFADDPAVRHRIVFLPDYDMELARYLVSGCDVWLNNPLRPLEACGTSGMKAAMNGALNLSVRDGWWDELADGQNGWSIPSASGVIDPDRRDDLESVALYELLESQVAPLFYDRGPNGAPARWVGMVRHTLRTLGPKVLASRMLRDYTRLLYMPAATASRRMNVDDHAAARELSAWRTRVQQAWSRVQVVHVEATGPGATPELGATMHLLAEVELAGLSPDDVEVQACSGRVDPVSDRLTAVRTDSMRYVGEDHGAARFEVDLALTRAGAFGYTVRVVPRHELLSNSAELGLVSYASSVH